jgi:hypothetical protein
MTSALRPSARRLAVLAAPLTLALAGFGTAAAPAHAATPLSVVNVQCSDDGLMPGRGAVDQFDCSASGSGGTGSYSYAWTGVLNGTFFYDANTDDGWGMCSVNQHSTVKITVTDSSGATASAQTSFLCIDQ